MITSARTHRRLLFSQRYNSRVARCKTRAPSGLLRRAIADPRRSPNGWQSCRGSIGSQTNRQLDDRSLLSCLLMRRVERWSGGEMERWSGGVVEWWEFWRFSQLTLFREAAVRRIE